jgi:hypothetical protein
MCLPICHKVSLFDRARIDGETRKAGLREAGEGRRDVLFNICEFKALHRYLDICAATFIISQNLCRVGLFSFFFLSQAPSVQLDILSNIEIDKSSRFRFTSHVAKSLLRHSHIVIAFSEQTCDSKFLRAHLYTIFISIFHLIAKISRIH